MSNKTVSVSTGKWRGLEAITLTTHKYEAVLLPKHGSNMVRLYDKENNLDILRTPSEQEMDEFLERPQVFGIPILFFPNRIKDGVFTYDDRKYSFEVNDFESHSHLHGFAHNRPWQVARTEVCGYDAVVVETVFIGNSVVDFYKSFPHEFEIRSIFKLSPEGLSHEIKVTNLSSQNMPVAIGFHTVLSVPFHPSGEPDSIVMKMGIGKRWKLSDVFMNTDELIQLDHQEQMFLDDGIQLSEKPIVGHYTANAFTYKGREYHGMVLEDQKNNVRICYETGKQYGHWVVWNDDGKKGFICPEPQTCAINAPNLQNRKNESGFFGIAPDETWSEITKIYSEPIA